MRLTTKPGHSAARIGILRICWANVEAAWTVSADVSSPSMTSISRMYGRGPEEVEADDLVGTLRGVRDLGDRQAGGVGGEDRVARA